MPILHIAQPIADAHQADILTILGSRPMPALDEKDIYKLTYTGDNPERQAAFGRLQHLTGVVVEY